MPAVPALTTLAALTTACALVVFAAGSAKAAQAAADVPPAAAPAQAATAAAASASGEHTAPAAGGVLRLVSIVPLERPSMVAERALLDLAFARAQLHYTLEFNPPERALERMRQGSVDGDVSRTERFEQFLPAALRMQPHLQNAFHFAFGRPSLPRLGGWADLQPYRVAYVRGFRTVEQRLSGAARCDATSTAQACLQMVELQRVDWCVLGLPRKGELPPDLSLVKPLQAVPIDAARIYLWLRPEQGEAARRLGQALRQLEHSGELQALMAAYRQPD